MNKVFIKNKYQEQKGFVLLFAVLVSTLVLAVGISIISIAIKQVTLSGSGRDSQYAFYAANTGAECALFWDLAYDSEGNQVFYSGPTLEATTDESVTCLGARITDDTRTCSPDPDSDSSWCAYFDGNTYVTKFNITYDPDRPYCAHVTVIKEVDAISGLIATTTVLSRGYNTCDEGNPRRIERALEFNY